MEQVAAAGFSRNSREVRFPGIHFGEVQHSSLDAWLVRGSQDEPLLDQQGRRVLSAESACGKVHRHGLARRLRNPDTGSDDHWERDEGDRLHLQSESLLGVTSLRDWRRRARRQYVRHLHLGAPGNPGGCEGTWAASYSQ